VTGDIRRAARLLDDAWRAEQQPQSSLQAATTAAYLLLNGDGDVEKAHRLLAGALDAAVERPDISAAVVDDALNTLMLLCYWDGSPELWNSFYDAIETWKSSGSDALSLASQTWADPARTAVPALAQLDAAIERLIRRLTSAQTGPICAHQGAAVMRRPTTQIDSRVLAATSDHDAALPSVKSVCGLIADSARVASVPSARAGRRDGSL
jgi:hypothetical protein